MKKLFTLLLFIPTLTFGQVNYANEYEKTINMLENGEIEEAYQKFVELEKIVPHKDTIYENILWVNTQVATLLEQEYRMEEQFEKSLEYGLSLLEIIKQGKLFFDKEYAKREQWAIKNIIVSYFGLGKYDEAEKYKKILYNAYKKKTLQEGIDEYFNFDYFKFEDKNIWGYEWYEELPKDRFSKSFTKVVYYVYSTDEDGNDKDQLYRLHVLMFHGTGQDFDYVLTKRNETDNSTPAATLYGYYYKKDIDYRKLKQDVIEVLKGNLYPPEMLELLNKK